MKTGTKEKRVPQKEEIIPLDDEGRLVVGTKDNGANFSISVDGVAVNIERSKLMGLLFLFADKTEQEDLLTSTEVKMKLISRLLKIRADKDMKAGDILVAHYTYPLPVKYADKLIEVSPEKYSNASITIDEAKIRYPEILL